MNKNVSLFFLLSTIFATILMQAPIEVFDSSYDFSKSSEQNKARRDAEQKKQYDQALREKVAREEDARKKAALENRQRKNREAAKEIRLRREGKPVPTRINTEVVRPITEVLGYKPAVPLEVKAPVKTPGDVIIDYSNEFSIARDNKKESAAKKLLSLPEDENITEQRIVDASLKKIKELQDNVIDFTTRELVLHRIEQARDLLVSKLATLPKEKITVSTNDFESLSSRSEEPGFGKNVQNIINKISRWFSSWGKPEEGGYAKTVLKQIFDGTEDSNLFESVEVKTALKDIIKDQTKETVTKMIEAIKSFVNEQKIGKTSSEVYRINQVAKTLLDSLNQTQASGTSNNQFDSGAGDFTDSGY